MRLEVGNALTMVYEATQAELNEVGKALQYTDKRYVNGNYKYYRKSMFNKRSKIFLTGLIVKVIHHLKEMRIPFTLTDTRQRHEADLCHQPISLTGIQFGKGVYDYQYEAVQAALKKRRGVLKLATGAGKTECAVAICKTLNQPALFITHRVNLLYQTAERFALRWPELKRNNRIGIVGDSQYRPNFMTFSTVQTLDSYLKNKMTGPELKDDLQRFRVLIIDEAHRAGANQFQKVARLMVNADFRIGLTATPFSKSEYENLCLLGVTGGIMHEVSASELIKKGVLAKPFFKFLEVREPGMSNLKHWLDVYERGIVQNTARNDMVINAANHLINLKCKPLVIVNHIEHMETLHRMFTTIGIKSKMASGNMGARDRAKSLKELGSGKLDTIVCTNIFDEGIDVKEVGGVVMAAGTKSAPAFMQRTGRAIRKKEENNRAIVIDFMDRQHPMLLKHSRQRLELVKAEEQFVLLDYK